MKKLVLALLLLFSLFVSAQETFTRRYNHYYSSLLEKKGEGQATFVTNLAKKLKKSINKRLLTHTVLKQNLLIKTNLK